MRYRAPAREAVDRSVFERPPLNAWRELQTLLQDACWPNTNQLNQRVAQGARERFVTQDVSLLADGLHYEQRIAERGQIATRPQNWHDLLNAMVWLRHPTIKRALNARQMDEIAVMGPRQRSRAQYALTQFDEAGVQVTLDDPELLALWDEHDWHGLFWRHRDAWLEGRIAVEVFGHALLELALTPGRLPVGKALVFRAGREHQCAAAITDGRLLNDPLELRPLPLAGIPGWLAENADEDFHLGAACYQPRRAGRRYPLPFGG